jgi:excisionase family DNA binding protein
MSPDPKKKYMAIEDVADLLGVNYQLIYRLVRSGDLPAIRLGRIYRVTQEDLDAYLKKQKTNAGGVCSACGHKYRSSLSLENSCEVCGEPVCKDCWERKGLRRCKEHQEK